MSGGDASPRARPAWTHAKAALGEPDGEFYRRGDARRRFRAITTVTGLPSAEELATPCPADARGRCEGRDSSRSARAKTSAASPRSCSTRRIMRACSRAWRGPSPISDGSIVDAKVFTTIDGFALDVFRCRTRRAARSAMAAGSSAAPDDRAHPGGRDLAARGARQAAAGASAPAFRARPRVQFDNEASVHRHGHRGRMPRSPRPAL